MDKDDLERAHNDGQRDGASRDYHGSLLSGRSHDEQQTYNEGFAHGKGTSDKDCDFDLGYIGNAAYIAGRNS
jgi:hypothetical protein